MDYIWLIIMMAAAAVLPDLLRRKRNYPKRKGPIPIPPRKEDVKRRRQSLQQPVKTTANTSDTKEKQTPVVSREETAARPAAAHPVNASHTPRAAVVPNPGVAATMTVPHMVQPEPWSTIEPEVKDIYAGLVWAELLDKPLALRNKNR